MQFAKAIMTALLMADMFSTAAAAAAKAVTLAVPGMTCAVCPITVKQALTRVPGVRQVKVSYQAKEAMVEYDDAATNPGALMKATADAGYPSTIKTGTR